MFYREYI